MSLFRRDTPAKDVAAAPAAPAGQPTLTPTPDDSSAKTTEERVREWWKNRFGEAIPDEMVRWMKQLTRNEARRQTLAASVLSPQQMARTEDMRRLAESRLRNIESSLEQLHRQHEWLHRYNEKKHELTEQQKRQHELNKQLAIIADEEQQLERFETFETIQGTFQRTMLLERQARNNKLAQSQLVSQIEDAQQQTADKQKQLKQLIDTCEEAANRMTVMRDQAIEAARMQGVRSILDLDRETTGQFAQSIEQQQMILSKEIQETEAQIASLAARDAEQNALRQTLEPHQSLLEHGEMVLTLLQRFAEMEERNRRLLHTQETQQNSQQEENDMLSRVFADYQRVESEIETLKGELEIHRQQNLGQSTHSLQKRASELNSRRQMLLAAQSLWNRIRLGYQLIEEKTQTVNRLRLDIDNLRSNIGELKPRIEHLRQLCHEKEYTLTLSKSQNVIQLRSDLREGASCTVCGATHHPYHSDTILEQNKLISELRTDFEQLQHELAGQEPQLQLLHDQLASALARRDVEEDALSRLRQRQVEDVKEWSVFASLDRTFAECSPSTNPEARTAMLRQLIENTAHEADDAQGELDRYNYHQTRINELNETLNKKTQQHNDLTVRLNEVNTGCQVMARMVEQTRQLRNQFQTQYTQLYERLNSLITINDWYATWQSSHESILLHIEQMMEQWTEVNREIAQIRHEQEMLTALLNEKRTQNGHLDNLAAAVHEAVNRREQIRKEDEKRYADMLGSQEVADYFDTTYQPLLHAHESEIRHREDLSQSANRLAALEGRLHELATSGETLDSELIDMRSQLDLWIRRFNASHPPVQYAELEQAFDQEKDWNALRQRIRDTRVKALLGQARVDSLRSAIVALQGEACNLANAEDESILDTLLAGQRQLERQRQEVFMQLAEQHIALRNHETSQRQMREEEERIYEMTNNKGTMP